MLFAGIETTSKIEYPVSGNWIDIGTILNVSMSDAIKYVNNKQAKYTGIIGDIVYILWELKVTQKFEYPTGKWWDIDDTVIMTPESAIKLQVIGNKADFIRIVTIDVKGGVEIVQDFLPVEKAQVNVLYINENNGTAIATKDNISYINIASGGGGGGTSDHKLLSNRNIANQHIISSITGLETILDTFSDQLSFKVTETEMIDYAQPKGDYVAKDELPQNNSELKNDSKYINSEEIKTIKILTRLEYDSLINPELTDIEYHIKDDLNFIQTEVASKEYVNMGDNKVKNYVDTTVGNINALLKQI